MFGILFGLRWREWERSQKIIMKMRKTRHSVEYTRYLCCRKLLVRLLVFVESTICL